MRTGILRAAFAGAVLAGVFAVGAEADVNPKKIEGPDECAECHRDEATVWRGTHHFSTFRDMPRSKDARKIARKMKIKRIKSESLCLNCHFTTQTKKKKAEVIAGISCELCHSEGKDWIKLHAEFSGKKKKELESKAEAAARWKKSEELGLIRPKALYKLAKNCYGCHVVPQEKLVNVGDHPAGSKFELVSWSQGEVRHNVWYNKGESNKKASPGRRRMMFLVGAIVEFETAIRAVGKATKKAKYAVRMAKRASLARKKLFAIIKRLPDVKELKAIAVLSKKAKFRLNNDKALTQIADRIAVEAVALVTRYDGSGFAKIDGLIPKPDKYKGKPARVGDAASTN